MSGKVDNTRTFRPEKSLHNVSREDIEEADDYGDIFDLADTMGVDLGGLDEIQDMKARLLMFYDKCEGEPNYKDVVAKSMVSALWEDKRKREKLIKLLKETRNKLGPFTTNAQGEKMSKRGSAVISSFLQKDGTIHNLDADIDIKLEYLERDKCTIVVSGETSAGKSSILNLLFGEEVVPTFFGSCTSVITRISYYKKRRAKIIYRNGKLEKILDIPQGEICKRLKPFLFVEDAGERDNATLIKEVIIQVPAKILECGLVIVDSPGIGENDEMDKVIVNFVGENQINAFIYAIKSDNAGGVDEDRLLGLLKVIIEKEKEKSELGILPFDPQCALFVCNLWDLIREDQDEIVFNHAYQKLTSIWPNLTRSQMLKFSAHRAKMECDIDPDFIINNYKELLENIKDLHSRAMDKRIVSTYKWLETVLKRSFHYLKTIVHRIDNSEEDMETKMRSIWEKLNTLKMKSELVINKLRNEIEDDTNEICVAFKSYLELPTTKMAVTSWIESELPDIETFRYWEELKENIEDATITRISKELEEWEDKQGKIKAVKDRVESSIQLQLNILEEELQDIEDDMQSETDSIASVDDDAKRKTRRYSIPIGAVQMQVSRLALPVKLVNRVLRPFGKIGKRLSNHMSIVINEGKLKDYRKDPITYAKTRSEKTLQSFLYDQQSNNLRSVISEFMREPKEFLKEIERKIPAMVETNQQNMDHISLCRKEGLSSREMYEQMMEGLEELKRIVTDYGEGNIFVNDFGADDIQIVTSSGEEGRDTMPFDVSKMLESVASSTNQRNQRIIPRGLWTAQQNGILFQNKKEEAVTIRIYLKNARIENTDSEVAKLRLLKNDNVAELIGIQHSNPTPAFVFRGNLKPLGHYLKGRLVKITEVIPRILQEILQGLEYIHRKKMVHMELNLNTVTVDDSAVVKLCGACRPKEAALPQDKDIVPAGDFVYLSPEVLSGDVYVACADVYAFGLLIFDLLVGTVFKDQRQMPLSVFIDNCAPNAMNGCPYSIEELNSDTQIVIQECLDVVIDKRPSVEQLMKSVLDIKNDTVLCRLQEQKKQQKLRKVSSESTICYSALRKSRSEEEKRQSTEQLSLDNSQLKSSDKENYQSALSEQEEPEVKIPTYSESPKTEVKNIFGACGKTGKTTVPYRERPPLLGDIPKQFKQLAIATENYASEQSGSSVSEEGVASFGSLKSKVLRTTSDTAQISSTGRRSIGNNRKERLTKSVDAGSGNQAKNIDQLK